MLPRNGANEFLKGYLPIYNKRFSVCPADETDVHVKLPRNFNIDKHLCIKTHRTLRNDNTVALNGKLYQVEEAMKTKKVVVENRLDGSMRIIGDGKSLKYRKITVRPMKETSAARKTHSQPVVDKDHPWRKNQKQLNNKWIWANAD
ncbi:MAG: hypothetical protein HQL01_15945 [Nitrospirae bacterium]|nr:hypothetical protein [Nitrospirota bacterium]